MRKKYFKKLSRALILTVFILSLTLTVLAGQAAADLSVHFIDVGQGDAILIQHEAENKNMLIDGGDRWNWVGEKLVEYLNQQGVEQVDAIVSTHPHADHIGGLDDVIHNFEVGRIYDSGRVHTTQTFENYLMLIDEKDIPYHTPRTGDKIELGELVFQVLHPGEDAENYSLNDASIVLRLEYHEISFFFTGDAEYQAEREIAAAADNYLELESTVLKVGHHGSSTSTNDFFLKEVNPEAAVIQVGEDNRYGHPDAEVLAALESRNIEIYRNDLQGDIVIETDGFGYQVLVSREAEPRAPPEDEPAEDEQKEEEKGKDIEEQEKQEEQEERDEQEEKEEMEEEVKEEEKEGEREQEEEGEREQEEEQEKKEEAADPSREADPDKVNLNTADHDELQELHGIGPAYAENIIEYRKEQGEFQTIEEIKEVPGIGPATFEDIKADITL